MLLAAAVRSAADAVATPGSATSAATLTNPNIKGSTDSTRPR